MAVPNITLTGNFEKLSGTSSGSLIITLKNFGNDQPRVSGTGFITDAQLSIPVPPGLTFSVTIWGNDQILPGATYYAISFYNSAGTLVTTLSYQFTGSGTLDLSTQTPISVVGTVVATIVAASVTASSLVLNGATSGSTTLQAAAVAGGTATLPNNTGIIAELNLPQTWTALQTFSGGFSGSFTISPGPVTLASNASAPRTATFPDNTGTIAETNFAQTWSANQTFGAGNLLLNPGPITLASAGSAARTVTFPDNTGTVAELNLAQTWSAIQTHSATIVPNAAGGVAIGTSILPWSSIFIGAAGTNNIQLTGTATGTRAATLPDNTGTIAELNFAQTWTAAQTFTAAAGVVPATVKGATAQSVDIFDVLDISNNVLFSVGQTGAVAIIPTSSGVIPLQVVGASGLSTDLIRAATGVSTKFRMNASGNIINYAGIATVSTGMPAIYGTTDTAATSNIAPTTLYTTVVGGGQLFRISVYIIVTTVAGTSSTLPSVVLAWTDANNNTVQSFTATPTNAGNTLTTFQQATVVINARSASATTISYQTTGYASVPGAAMGYMVSIRVEQL